MEDSESASYLPSLLTVYIPRKPARFTRGQPSLETSSKICFVNQLPVELLSNIFLLLKGHPTAPPDDEDAHVSDIPLHLSHVDRHWRQVAIDTPMLWTFIQISDRRRLSYLARTEAYLDRSGSLPLDISVWWRPTDNYLVKDRSRRPIFMVIEEAKDTFRPHVLEELQELLLHVGRWRHFRLVMDDFLGLQQFIAMFSGNKTPSLTHLTLSYISDGGHHGYHPSAPGEIAPMITHEAISPIQSLFLNGVRINWTFPACRNLTQLILRHGRPDTIPCIPDLIIALSQSPGIRSLHFDEIETRDSYPLPNPSSTVLLSALERLYVGSVKVPWAQAFFNSIIAPNLRILEFDIYGDWCDGLISILIRPYKSLGRSILRSVRALQLNSLSLEHDDVELRLSMYRELEDLVVLVVNCSPDYGDENFLDAVTDHTNHIARQDSSPAQPSFLFPRLRTLILADPNIDEVKALVTARQRAGMPIQRLFFRVPEDIEQNMISLEDAGWLAQNVKLFASFPESESWGCAIDDTLERLLEADLAVEVDGLSFLDVFCST